MSDQQRVKKDFTKRMAVFISNRWWVKKLSKVGNEVRMFKHSFSPNILVFNADTAIKYNKL